MGSLNDDTAYIAGYSSRFSVAPGEEISFHVDARGIREFEAELVPLIKGAANRDTGLQLGTYPAMEQETAVGSYAEIHDDGLLDLHEGFTIGSYVCPETVTGDIQCLLGKWDSELRVGYALVLERGRASLWLGHEGGVNKTSVNRPVLEGVWYLVVGSWDRESSVAWVSQTESASNTNSRLRSSSTASQVTIRQDVAAPTLGTASSFTMSAMKAPSPSSIQVASCFNGKLDDPFAVGESTTPEGTLAKNGLQDPHPATIAAWDFSAEISPEGIVSFEAVTDHSVNQLNGRLVNSPTRAVTGFRWSGTEHDFRKAPSEYSAIRFHEDDTGDMGWPASFSWVPPASHGSRALALRLKGDGVEDHIPFIVRPPQGTNQSSVALLLPSNTYLAYANDHMAVDGPSWPMVTGRNHVLNSYDLLRHAHREYGASLYDSHTDGSGVCYSCWRRPILNLRAEPQDLDRTPEEEPSDEVSGSSNWGFPADLLLLKWLQNVDQAVDLISDWDLASEGKDLLQRYRVIMTGSHPEYYSGSQLDAFQAYIDGGGRLMYLGGNGFYWVTAYHPEDLGTIEVRRWGGTQTWTAAPGEHHLSFTGELGGLWRSRGRAPQKLVGVGFIAQGGDVSTYYRRSRESYSPSLAWIFAGTSADVIGNHGTIGGGAAGLEIDSYDAALGSSPDAVLLAASEDHTQVMCEVRENIPMSTPALGGNQNPHVHADMVLLTNPAGGAVFSVGSIAWSGSLSENGGDNDIAQVTLNVLNRFLKEGRIMGDLEAK